MASDGNSHTHHSHIFICIIFFFVNLDLMTSHPKNEPKSENIDVNI